MEVTEVLEVAQWGEGVAVLAGAVATATEVVVAAAEGATADKSALAFDAERALA